MIRPAKYLVFLCCALCISGCGPTYTQQQNLPPLKAVPEVDIDRYMGTWYEIASYPQRFQKGCTGTTATYSLREDGEVDVVNRCFLDSLKGEEKVAEGRARVLNTVSNAELEVSFFRPFWGDYWIIELGEDYEYAAVGHPGREYLWILSRSPRMEENSYQAILHRLRDIHLYPLGPLEKTLQPDS